MHAIEQRIMRAFAVPAVVMGRPRPPMHKRWCAKAIWWDRRCDCGLGGATDEG